MSFMGKRRWGSMMNNSSLGYTLHGGSVPNLLSPPRPEGLVTLKKRLSMDILRGWAPDLGSLSMGLNLNLSPVKWPSLVTVCKWKQSLTEKLKKRHVGTEDGSQVRKLAHARRWETDWHPCVGRSSLYICTTFRLLLHLYFKPFSLLRWLIGKAKASYTAVYL